ncbi:hypothetical protein AGMMS49921_08720 [Endomicrobiia bacterium]|nr:hypothetical protein AGMMS49921_08720 [Endomicrobiia bacterium]
MNINNDIYNNKDTSSKVWLDNSLTTSNSVGFNQMSGTIKLVGVNKTMGDAMFETDRGTIFIDNYNKLLKKYDVSTQKLLNYLASCLISGNHNKRRIDEIVKLRISDYLDIIGRTHHSWTRKRVLQDLDIIFNTRIDWVENRPHYKMKKIEVAYAMHILAVKASTKCGEAIVKFTPDMAKYLVNHL